jgi:hypothetical protein
MPEKPTNIEHRVTTGPRAQANQEADPSTVQDWKPDLQSTRTRGPAAANRSAKAHAIVPSEEGSRVNANLAYPAWHKPYAEALLTTDPEILVKLLAVTKRAVFERLLELAAEKDLSDEKQDIRRALDVLLTLRAGNTQAGLRQIPLAGSSARRARRVLHHNGKIEYRGLS